MDKAKMAQFAQRVFSDMAGTMSAALAYVGVETGLFRAMAGQGPMSLDAVVDSTGLQRRYVEEWLAGMVAAGYLDYDPEAVTYALSDEHAFLLASDDTDHFVGGLFYAGPAFLSTAPQVVRAFREGGGVPFQDFSRECLIAVDLMNRGNYEHRLADYWLAELPQVVAALRDGGNALDVGCGVGHVSLNLAKAFPQGRFVGVDLHGESVARAREHASSAGFDERVRFVDGSLDRLGADERFDLITCCDCVHDFAAPEETLRSVGERLAPDGTLFVVEPKAADKLEDNRNPISAMFYGFSVFHCMTQSLANGGPGLGTCMGPARTEQLLRSSGFSRFRQLPIRSQVNLFYAAQK